MKPRYLASSVMVLHFVVAFIATMLFSSPVYLGAFYLSVLFGLYRAGRLAEYRGVFMASVSLSLLLILINLIVSQSGETQLVAFPAVGLLGQIVITKESLLFAFTMALKLILVFALFFCYDAFVGADRSFTFFSRNAPTSALIVVLTSLLIPQIKRRVWETHMAIAMRGGNLLGSNIVAQVKSRIPLLKVLLLSTLEDSWTKAEALHLRGYGIGTRTRYYEDRLQPADWVFSLCLAVQLIVSVTAVFTLGGHSSFFPRATIQLSLGDCLAATALGLLFVAPLVFETPKGTVEC